MTAANIKTIVLLNIAFSVIFECLLIRIHVVAAVVNISKHHKITYN